MDVFYAIEAVSVWSSSQEIEIRTSFESYEPFVLLRTLTHRDNHDGTSGAPITVLPIGRSYPAVSAVRFWSYPRTTLSHKSCNKVLYLSISLNNYSMELIHLQLMHHHPHSRYIIVFIHHLRSWNWISKAGFNSISIWKFFISFISRTKKSLSFAEGRLFVKTAAR